MLIVEPYGPPLTLMRAKKPRNLAVLEMRGFLSGNPQICTVSWITVVGIYLC